MDSYNFLSLDEVNLLPKAIVNKINDAWSMKNMEWTGIKTDIEKLKITSEQEKIHLERELQLLKSSFEEERKQKEDTKQRLVESDKKVESLEVELHSSNGKVAILSRDISRFQDERESASEQSVTLAGTVESRGRVISQLYEQIQDLENQLVVSLKAKCEATLQTQRLEQREVELKFSERRLTLERELMQQQLNLLQEQLKQRTMECINQQNDQTSTTISLQTELHRKSEEVTFLQREVSEQKEVIEEKTSRVQVLLEALNEVREGDVKLEEVFQKELDNQKKLVEIYIDNNEVLNLKNKELSTAVEELQKLLQEATDNAKTVGSENEKLESRLMEVVQQNQEKVMLLQDELKKANQLLETLGIVGIGDMALPTGQAKGPTTTEIYSRLIETSQRLLKSEDENQRLSRQLEDFVQAIQERTPFMLKQKDDLRRALETINMLNTRLDRSNEEMETLRLKYEEALKRKQYTDMQHSRMSWQAKDLARQVAVLVLQAEAARAGLPMPDIPEGDLDEEVSLKANDVISERLVCFRSVAELQQQNQMLRATLREVSSEKEAGDQSTDVRVQELMVELSSQKEELTEAMTELERLRESRKNLETQMTSIIQQRDLYRSIAAPKTPSQKVDSGEHDSLVHTERVEMLRHELEELRRELKAEVQKHLEYREEKEKAEKIMADESKKLRMTCENTKKENVKLLSRAEYDDERLKTMKSNEDLLRRNITTLEAKNEALERLKLANENALEDTKNNLFAMEKKLTQSESELNNLRGQNLLLKDREKHLLLQVENYKSMHSSIEMLHMNHQTLMKGIEEQKGEDKSRLQNLVTSLSEQNGQLKFKLQNNVDLKNCQAKLKEAEAALEGKQTECLAVSQQVEALSVELKLVQSMLSEAKEHFNVSTVDAERNDLPDFSASVSSPSFRSSQSQLHDETARCSSLQASLELTQRNVDDLRGILTDREQQLTQLNETNQALMTQLQNIEKLLDDANSRISQLNEQHEEMIKNSQEKMLHSEVEMLKNELSELEVVLQQEQEATQQAKVEELKAVEELQGQKSLLADVWSKYEKQGALHAADLSTMAAMREKLATLGADLGDLKGEKEMADNKLKELIKSMEEREHLFASEKQSLVSRIEEMGIQNQALAKNFALVSDKMVYAQKQISLLSQHETEGATPVVTDSDLRISEQLRELTNYLQRELELSAAKEETAVAEAQRLEVQRKQLAAQLEKGTGELKELRRKSANFSGSVQERDALRHIATVDALTDSNRQLKEERDSLKLTVEELRSSCETVKELWAPLKQELEDTKGQLETSKIDKQALEAEVELCKTRNQNLVDKLNRCRPEDFNKLRNELQTKQKEIAESAKTIQLKDAEINRNAAQLQMVRKQMSMVLAQKKELESQLNLLRVKIKDDMDALTLSHQQVLAQCKGREETLKRDVEKLRSEFLELKTTANSNVVKVAELSEEKEELIKQAVQLRKIATKYKQKVSQATSEENPERVKELETKVESLEALKEKMETDASLASQEQEKLQKSISDLNTALITKTAELETLRTMKDAELSRLQEDSMQKFRESISSKQELSRKLEELKKLNEELQSKNMSAVEQFEKTRNELLQEKELLNKKLSMQQKQLELLQKTIPGKSKATTSGMSTEKSSSETPPTANIKPMAAPVPAVATPRAQAAAATLVPSSRAIPMASIRPMGPPSGSSGTLAGGSVGGAPQREAHDGMVSSTVTLPQATVTPTTTLTATISPVVVSISTAPSVVNKVALQSSVASQSSVMSATIALTMAGPSSDATQSSNVSESTETCQRLLPNDGFSAEAAISQVAITVPLSVPQESSHKRLFDDSCEERVKRPRLEVTSGVISLGSLGHCSGRVEDSGPSSSLVSAEGGREGGEEVVMEQDEDVILVSEDEEDDDEGVEEELEEEEEEDLGGEEEEEDEDLSLEGVNAEGGREASEMEEEAEAEAVEVGEEEEEEEDIEEDQDLSSTEHPQPSGSGPQPSSSNPDESHASRVSLPTRLGPMGPRQNLLPFSQLPQYEEAGVDDSIVPSTPTLFASRRGAGDGFSEVVSSPHVPSGGFVFGNPNSDAPQTSGLAQMAEGGLIDDTQMDLALINERSLPTTPFLRSPTGAGDASSNESGVSTSASAGFASESTLPNIVVSPPAEQSLDEESYTEADSMAQSEGEEAEVVDIDSDDDDDENGDEVAENEEDHQSGGDDQDDEAAGEGSNSNGEDSLTPSQRRAPSSSHSSSSMAAAPSARRITPIVWNNADSVTSQSIGRGYVPASSRGRTGVVIRRGLLVGARRSGGPGSGPTARRSRPPGRFPR